MAYRPPGPPPSQGFPSAQAPHGFPPGSPNFAPPRPQGTPPPGPASQQWRPGPQGAVPGGPRPPMMPARSPSPQAQFRPGMPPSANAAQWQMPSRPMPPQQQGFVPRAQPTPPPGTAGSQQFVRPPMMPATTGTQQPVRMPQQQQVPPSGFPPAQHPSPIQTASSPPATVHSPPLSPTGSVGTPHSSSRRRAYPEQITSAYNGSQTGGYTGGGQFFTPAGGAPVAPAPPPTIPSTGAQQQNPMYYDPSAANKVPAFAGGMAAYAYQGQAATPDNVASQFQGMNLGAQMALQHVPLMGNPPSMSDLELPPPQIRLPPNATVTPSPYANPDPVYARCTLNAFPATQALLNKSKLPLGLILAPYKTTKEDEVQVPVVTDTVIARCRRCRAYINPFVTFIEGGQRWKCNLCYLLNDVPAAFDYDHQTQQPVDRWQRAELNHGVVEFVAPTEYMVRPPQPPVYIFVIDVSFSAIQSGMVATAARAILNTLDRIPNVDNRTKIGFITVDSSLHFFNLNSITGEPQMLVVSDLEDVFLPQPNDLLVNLTESRAVVESLLGRLGEMFKDTHNINNALGPAMQAAYKLISPIGGKIIVLQSTLPNMGAGALKPREDVKLLGTPKESSLLQPASSFYKSFAIDCSRSQVSVDIFVLSSQYSDIATLGCAPRYTGGQLFFYPAFNASKTEDALKFTNEFADNLSSHIALEAVMRVRASRGVHLSTFHGNFFVRSTDLMALPNVPRDQSYCVEMQLEENLTVSTIYFQTAVLHTTCFGERRIRVLTLALPVTSQLTELYASADQVAIAALLANKAVERATTSKLDDARDALTNKCVDILGSYKTTMMSAASGAVPQLQITDNLKLLPLLILGLLKHVGLRQSTQIPSDLRAHAQDLLRILPAQLLADYLLPRFYAIHTMPLPNSPEDEKNAPLPQRLNLTAERMERHGCYLLENGHHIFLWVGREAHPRLCADLFESGYEGIRSGKTTLPTLDNPLSRAVHRLIAEARGEGKRWRGRTYYPTVYVVKEDGDAALRMWFLSHLIEDRADSIASYQQWLGSLRDKVNSGSF
ncbi:uncharacterized protein VTP21DRAFT_10481 [Calcarisporiella thermophila]|uniref:uncharacterized protein n=1 Tax=Calcarisporiella thermophila TaxID=911321 RepID=UPI00374432AE